MHACISVCEMKWVNPSLCKHSGLLQDGVPLIIYYYLCVWLVLCSLYLTCNHEMCPWSMYCCVACLGGTDCSGMCACSSAFCRWQRIVWWMHVSCTDSDVHSCFKLSSALSQSSWIRRYISVMYYYYYLPGLPLTPTMSPRLSLSSIFLYSSSDL